MADAPLGACRSALLNSEEGDRGMGKTNDPVSGTIFDFWLQRLCTLDVTDPFVCVCMQIQTLKPFPG